MTWSTPSCCCSPTNAKAFNTMRQRLKKHNQQYEQQLVEFRANPVVSRGF